MTNPVSEYLQGFQQVVMAAAEGKHASKVPQLCGGAPGEERGNEWKSPTSPEKNCLFKINCCRVVKRNVACATRGLWTKTQQKV